MTRENFDVVCFPVGVSKLSVYETIEDKLYCRVVGITQFTVNAKLFRNTTKYGNINRHVTVVGVA